MLKVNFFNQPYLLYAGEISLIPPPTKAHVIQWDKRDRVQSNAIVICTREVHMSWK